MDKSAVDKLRSIPQPSRESIKFIEDLKSPLAYHFSSRTGCHADAGREFMKNGVTLKIEFPDETGLLETSYLSLRRVLTAKGIQEKNNAYPISFLKDLSLGQEAYSVKITSAFCILSAADMDGMRRGVYFLEDRICETQGAGATVGEWNRHPFVKHRISRCFFGPTYRPPFFVDELTNDIDYYPEEYLNKLAHEGVNGLWISMYFRDLPSSIFPKRGVDAERRFQKLRSIVKRCARFGIRIYVYFSEPKYFGSSDYSIPIEDAKGHPELIGERIAYFSVDDTSCSFCTSTQVGKKYFEESITQLFTAVPDLGGIINIMFGEDNGACVSRKLYPNCTCHCPLCSTRDSGDIFREMAEIMSKAMHQINPSAEFIGWFYAPGIRDGSVLSQRLETAVDRWPPECGIMFNFESGGVSNQLGKERNVYDYSLAYLGPSELFRAVAAKSAKPAAKLQVGCSHEDASVPFIPVPGNLYEKYKIIRELGVYAVMQCWYFGNYPGLMNKAAGELSFEPFPENEDEFLTALARPDWRKHAPQVACAWKYLAQGYRKFPANIAFAWYGALHHSIAWPLHLFPVDEPISPSWILKHFPEISGDRIGECLIYQHTLPEALTLCCEMRDLWQKGTDILESLRDEFVEDPARIADINLARAILLQMRSTCNLLQFYSYREEMFFEHKDHLDAMRTLVRDEIQNSRIMIQLCEQDSRLGYHSEAEGYLFFPEKLTARIAYLEQLLREDFPKFKMDAPFIAEYTGETPKGATALCCKDAPGTDKQPIGIQTGVFWSSYYDKENLYLVIEGTEGKAFAIEIEPCRLWPPVLLNVSKEGIPRLYDIIFRKPPVFQYLREQGALTIVMPLSTFDGYRRENFPMRINVRCEGEAWVKHCPWPARLLHENYNPVSAGWLVFE
jgi:hypothetical protein